MDRVFKYYTRYGGPIELDDEEMDAFRIAFDRYQKQLDEQQEADGSSY